MDHPRARRRAHARRIKARMRRIADDYRWNVDDRVLIGTMAAVHGTHDCELCNRQRARYGPRWSERRALAAADAMLAEERDE